MRFSVCIPTLNARETWRDFSAALRRQSARPDEVIVIDSSSDDDTAGVAARDGYEVITIAREDFRHGATRQLAANRTQSEVIVYLTQDALLASDGAMAQLLRVFDDPTVGAAYGRQLPRHGAGPIEAFARIFNYPESSHTNSVKDIPARGFKTVFFSNSFGAYRMSALRQVGGFPPDANFGEDTVVAAQMVLAGWKIAYVAEAAVYHSHAHTLREEYRRYKAIGELHARQAWMLEKFGHVSGEGMRFLRSMIEYLAGRAPQHIPEALAMVVCKFVGYRVGRRWQAAPRGPS
jgi:rhamnosyltransferase